MKIVIKEERIILDEELEDTSLEEVVEELPERQPRYPLLYFWYWSYKHECCWKCDLIQILLIDWNLCMLAGTNISNTSIFQYVIFWWLFFLLINFSISKRQAT